jgi:hypothetical protein
MPNQRLKNRRENKIPLQWIACIIIISLLMSSLLRHRPSLRRHIRRTGHNQPHGPSAGWWVLTTANAIGTNGLTCLTKQRGAREKKIGTGTNGALSHWSLLDLQSLAPQIRTAPACWLWSILFMCNP